MRVAVIGGGLSGLFTGVQLLAQGMDDLMVLERSARPGGVTQTITRNGFSLEPAVGSFTLPHPHLGPIVESGAAAVTESAASARYLYAGGTLVEIPASPRALLAPVLPLGAKLRALAEPLVKVGPRGEESLAGIFRRRFGRDAGDLFAGVMASGVYAGDPERLSAGSAFPAVKALAEEHGSMLIGALRKRRSRPADAPTPRIHIPVGGMSELAGALARSLGEHLRLGFRVDSLRQCPSGWVIDGDETLHAEQVAVAMRPEHAAFLVDEQLADLLQAVTSAPVAVVGLGGLGVQPFPEGFGALIAPEEGMGSLGFLFESSYAPGRAPIGSWLLKVIVGGSTRPELVDEEIDYLADLVLDESALVLGRRLQPSFLELVRHRPGIPQPELGHGRWLAAVEDLLARRHGLYLTGWGYRGVGVGNLATDAARIAETISRRAG